MDPVVEQRYPCAIWCHVLGATWIPREEKWRETTAGSKGEKITSYKETRGTSWGRRHLSWRLRSDSLSVFPSMPYLHTSDMCRVTFIWKIPDKTLHTDPWPSELCHDIAGDSKHFVEETNISLTLCITEAQD